MRVKAETLLIAAMSFFALAGVTAVVLQDTNFGEPAPLIFPVIDPAPIEPAQVEPGPLVGPTADDGVVWFQSIRQYCNSVEAETRIRWQPAPDTEGGSMHEAACYALAGKIDLARAVIERLPQERRYHAAGVVFSAGHPAADAGDDLAAGPLMELVVEFWPNHYMALYHAGASTFERGEQVAARSYLTRFLEEYSVEDGWRANAISMLEEMDGREG
jgi:hypothetical protein